MQKNLARVALVVALPLGVLAARRRLAARSPLVAPVDPLSLISVPPQPAHVSRLADGRLRFYWLQAAAVTLRDQSGTALGAAQAATELILPDPAPGQRAIYTLDFEHGAVDGRTLLVAERFLPLRGAGNFRDLGGYETADGRRTRWGRVYRSGDLSALNDADHAYLESLPLRTVCDLRSVREREEQPDRLPAGAAYQPLAVYENAPRAAFLRTMLFDRRRLGQVMAESYPRMLEQGAAAYGELFRLLADEANLPLVFHCSAGKDRAGIAAALLLEVLGVPRETIVADYSLSNHNFAAIFADLADNAHLARMRIKPEELTAVTAADPAWLRGLFDYLDERYGGARGYLLGPAGLDEETLAVLQSALLQ